MGFIEETGAAQYYRDARILTIYEGTTAIQANDFVGRKTVRDRGAVARQFLEQVRETEQALEERGGDDLVAIAARLRTGREALSRAVDYVVDTFGDDVRSVFAGSVPYLKLAGVVLCGWQMARAASKAQAMRSAGVGDARFLDAKITTARFYADHILVQAPGIADTIVEGARGVLALPESAF
jgi:butyryl-CoA dehydrogenase